MGWRHVAYQPGRRLPDVTLSRQWRSSPVSEGRWEVFELTDEKRWGGMSRGRSLSDFFGEEDHVASVTELFESLLDDVLDFKNRYPKLPWAPQQQEPAAT